MAKLSRRPTPLRTRYLVYGRPRNFVAIEKNTSPGKEKGRRDPAPAFSTSWSSLNPLPYLQAPTLPIFALEVRVGLGAVLRLDVGRVPLELLADAHGDVAEQDELREGAGVAEVGHRGGAALAGVDPLLVVAGGARDRLLRLLHLGELVLWEPLGGRAVVVGRVE